MPRRPKTPAKGLTELTALELELMQVVWRRGDATAAEVRQALAPARDLADTTIHTVLSNLRKKGYIEPIPTVERVLRFAPKVQREQVGARSARRLLEQFFGGSPQRLMAHLMQSEAVDEAELAELRKLLRGKTGRDTGGKRS